MFAQLAPLMHKVAATIVRRRSSSFTFQTVVGLRGVGKFLGWQTCLDLGYWNPAVYNEFEHVHVGPGAEMGLYWLFHDMGALDRTQCIQHLVAIQNEQFQRVGVDAVERRRLFGALSPVTMTASGAEGRAEADPHTQHFNLMAMEGCLCEANKYFRVLYRDGSARCKQHYVARRGADTGYASHHAQTLQTLRRSWGKLAPPRTREVAAQARGWCLKPNSWRHPANVLAAASARRPGPGGGAVQPVREVKDREDIEVQSVVENRHQQHGEQEGWEGAGHAAAPVVLTGEWLVGQGCEALMGSSPSMAPAWRAGSCSTLRSEYDSPLGYDRYQQEAEVRGSRRGRVQSIRAHAAADTSVGSPPTRLPD
jgi:hypothetical protein